MARIGARRGRRAAPTDPVPDWLDRMLARKPVKVMAIAPAARMARHGLGAHRPRRTLPGRAGLGTRLPPDPSGGPETVRRSVR
jgi:hypothetical protein